MKLRNKKTGFITELDLNVRISGFPNSVEFVKVSSLAKLNEEWEDYEEPKEYWYISCDGRVLKATTDEDDYNDNHITGHKQIDNYFETEEEAEKAVEKLKAWKRLKDKGFKFSSCEIDLSEVVVPEIIITASINTEELETLNLVHSLFGGEEC